VKLGGGMGVVYKIRRHRIWAAQRQTWHARRRLRHHADGHRYVGNVDDFNNHDAHGSVRPPTILSCCNQAITRFDRLSVSEMAMLQQ
jgi:hypothetical protein